VVVPLLLEQTRAFVNAFRRVIGDTMLTGSVKKIVNERGFGFIAADDGQEYFFHRSSVDSSLEFDRLGGGERVTFDIERSDKGPRACQVSAA
jgi:cold shock protein